MSGTLVDAGRFAFQLAFQVSPIILVGGIASQFGIEGMLPIIGLTEPVSIVNGLFTGSGLPSSLDEAFCQFVPISGSTLINNQIGMYPFANQTVAANAIIQQPLNVSMLMIAPVNTTGGYVSKIATFTLLQNALSQHNALGGTYTIATPAFVYANCIMTGMHDVTGGEGKQPQVMWQLDFVQPLISLSDATQAYNTQMTALANQVPPTGSGAAPLAGVLSSNVSSYVTGTAPVVPVIATPL